MNNTYFNKLPVLNDDHILVQSQWYDDKIVIFLQEPTRNRSFKAEISTDELKESATELEIPYEEFYNDCRKALTTNLGVESFVYEFDKDQDKLLLNKKDTFTIQYLDIQLEENDKIVSDMLEAAIGVINTEIELRFKSDGSNEKLQQDYQETVDALEKCIEEKNHFETKLLKKFALLLNSKKNKIAELQEILAEKGYNLEDKDANRAHNKEEDYNMDELGTEPSTSAVAKERTNSKKSKKKIVTVESDEDDYLAGTQVMTPPINDESN